MIYGHILDNPGLNFSELKKLANLPNGTITYHLKTLERENMIKSYVQGTHRIFFSSKIKITSDFLKLTEVQRLVFNIIKANPGISQVQVAKKAGIGKSGISKIIHILIVKGLVSVERGQRSRCFVNSDSD
jgi:predicted transcriptional regulator